MRSKLNSKILLQECIIKFSSQEYFIPTQVVTNIPQRVITDSGQLNEFHLTNGLSDVPPKVLLNSPKCSLRPVLSVFVAVFRGVAFN